MNRPHPTSLQASQFSLLDIVTLMSLAGIACAILVPVIRMFQGRQTIWMLAFLFLQAICFILFRRFFVARRRSALFAAGKPLGVGYVGLIEWKHWPFVKASIPMIGAAILAAWMAVVLDWYLQMILQTGISLLVLIPQIFTMIQMTIFFCYLLHLYLWRAYPGSIEFYEQGIIHGGIWFFDWQNTPLRTSKIYPGRIVIVMRQRVVPKPGSIFVGGAFSDLRVVRVAPELRNRVFEEYAVRVGPSNANDSGPRNN